MGTSWELEVDCQRHEVLERLYAEANAYCMANLQSVVNADPSNPLAGAQTADGMLYQMRQCCAAALALVAVTTSPGHSLRVHLVGTVNPTDRSAEFVNIQVENTSDSLAPAQEPAPGDVLAEQGTDAAVAAKEEADRQIAEQLATVKGEDVATSE